MKTTQVQVIPCDEAGSHRTHSILGLSTKQITERLGFPPNVKDDPDKVKSSWGFKVDGVLCGVWDYKGSHRASPPVFSAFGTTEALTAVFGANVQQ